MPRRRARVTYLSPEEKEALRANCHPRFAEALWVCIRTGVRHPNFASGSATTRVCIRTGVRPENSAL